MIVHQKPKALNPSQQRLNLILQATTDNSGETLMVVCFQMHFFSKEGFNLIVLLVICKILTVQIEYYMIALLAYKLWGTAVNVCLSKKLSRSVCEADNSGETLMVNCFQVQFLE